MWGGGWCKRQNANPRQGQPWEMTLVVDWIQLQVQGLKPEHELNITWNPKDLWQSFELLVQFCICHFWAHRGPTWCSPASHPGQCSSGFPLPPPRPLFPYLSVPSSLTPPWSSAYIWVCINRFYDASPQALDYKVQKYSENYKKQFMSSSPAKQDEEDGLFDLLRQNIEGWRAQWGSF